MSSASEDKVSDMNLSASMLILRSMKMISASGVSQEVSVCQKDRKVELRETSPLVGGKRPVALHGSPPG